MTLIVSPDRRRCRLHAREPGGTARVSFNPFRLSGGHVALRPCEMPAATVIDVVCRYDAEGR